MNLVLKLILKNWDPQIWFRILFICPSSIFFWNDMIIGLILLFFAKVNSFWFFLLLVNLKHFPLAKPFSTLLFDIVTTVGHRGVPLTFVESEDDWAIDTNMQKMICDLCVGFFPSSCVLQHHFPPYCIQLQLRYFELVRYDIIHY